MNSVWHDCSFNYNYYNFAQLLLVARICRWQTLAVPRMRPPKLVVTVQGLVGVVQTTSTTMRYSSPLTAEVFFAQLPPPQLPPPPPLTAEVFFAQFLGSQRNAEQSQKNMEDFLRTIAKNVQRGNN
jgi:hypothetical protein